MMVLVSRKKASNLNKIRQKITDIVLEVLAVPVNKQPSTPTQAVLKEAAELGQRRWNILAEAMSRDQSRTREDEYVLPSNLALSNCNSCSLLLPQIQKSVLKLDSYPCIHKCSSENDRYFLFADQ